MDAHTLQCVYARNFECVYVYLRILASGQVNSFAEKSRDFFREFFTQVFLRSQRHPSGRVQKVVSSTVPRESVRKVCACEYKVCACSVKCVHALTKCVCAQSVCMHEEYVIT